MIPIVFGVSEDPVKLGLVASIARPGGNATGVSFLLSELGAKQLGLLRELISAASRVGLLVNPNNENAKAIISDLKSAAAMNRARSGLPSDRYPDRVSVPSPSKPSRYGLVKAEHTARLVQRPTLTARRPGRSAGRAKETVFEIEHKN